MVRSVLPGPAVIPLVSSPKEEEGGHKQWRHPRPTLCPLASKENNCFCQLTQVHCPATSLMRGAYVLFLRGWRRVRGSRQLFSHIKRVPWASDFPAFVPDSHLVAFSSTAQRQRPSSNQHTGPAWVHPERAAQERKYLLQAWALKFTPIEGHTLETDSQKPSFFFLIGASRVFTFLTLLSFIFHSNVES